jgi:hypothetical protein
VLKPNGGDAERQAAFREARPTADTQLPQQTGRPTDAKRTAGFSGRKAPIERPESSRIPRCNLPLSGIILQVAPSICRLLWAGSKLLAQRDICYNLQLRYTGARRGGCEWGTMSGEI